jgi:type II secretory pathway component GspD/PulD (secretin)
LSQGWIEMRLNRLHLFIAAALLLSSFQGILCYAKPDETSQKIFPIKFRKLNDVVLKIKPFLSREAKLNLNYSDNSLRVEDFPVNLGFVEREVKAFDRLPYKIGIHITVISASKMNLVRESRKNEAGQIENISFLPDELNKILNYKKYKQLDALSIVSKEGENYTMSENDRYNLQFYSDYIDAGSGAVVLKDFTLFLKNKLPSGITVSKRLLRTDINLIPGQKLILGGTKTEESPEAIFFIIETETAK